MVDQISSWTNAATPIAPVTRVSAPQKVASVATPQADTAAATVAPSQASQLSASAPVDLDRVTRIKDAIANGTFPLSPSTIADALIALRYQWMSNDQA